MFVVIEGPNGSGKSCLAKNLEKQHGYVSLFSPGSTDLSKLLRPICRGVDEWKSVDPMVQLLCFSAARYDEYLRIVEPNRNKKIVSDRWWTSTIVYQCMTQGMSYSLLEQTIHPRERIDMVICLDGTTDVLIERYTKERSSNSDHGLCTWTSQRKEYEKVIENYRKLPDYLESRGIPSATIDTTHMTIEQVLSRALFHIKESVVLV